MTSSQCFSI